MADQANKILSVQLDASKAIQGITQLNRLIQDEKELMKQLTAENKKGSEQYAVAEKTVQELNRTKRQLQREIKAEVILEREQNGSLNQLRNQLSDLTKKYDQLSRAERENINVGGKLQKQINQVTNEIKSAEQSTQRYYRNVGNYQNAIMSALGMNNKYIQSIMLISSSSQGVSGAFSAMATSAKAFGKALWGLMANPAFLALAGIAGAGMAFKWFYDYNVEVENAMRLTREFTGVTGDALVHLRAEIQATASTYGKEYKEVLEGVDLLMSHFGITSAEAIRTLNDGFMIGADINGNYLQLLKQYAPVFKDAGVSAEQLVALIQQTRSGIFSQQGLEAIKQASARIREMSSGTRQSLQGIGIDVDDLQRKLRTNQIEMVDAIKMVSDRLKDVGNNTQEYGNVMADVFGRQGKFSSQEMIESLGDIDTNLQHLKESAGEYGVAMDDNQRATADLEEAAARFFNVGENGWETIKTKADTYWKEALANAITKTDNLIDKIKLLYKNSTTFQTVGKIIAGVIGVFTVSIGEMFNSVLDGLKATAKYVEGFVQTFKSAFAIIADLGKGAWLVLQGEFSQGVDLITASVKKNVNNVLATFSDAIKLTKKTWKNFGNAVSEGYNMAVGWLDSYSYSSEPDPDLILRYNGNNNGNGNGNGGGGGTTGNGRNTAKRGSTTKGSTPKANTTKTTGKTDAEKEAERIARERLKVAQKLVNDAEKLQKKADDELAKISRESIATIFQKRIDELNQQYDFVIKITKEQEAQLTDEEKKVLAEARTTYGVLLKGIEDERKKAYDNYDAQQAKERAERTKKARELAKVYADNMLATTEDGTKQWLEAYLKTLDIAQQEELRTFDANNQLKASNLTQWLETRNSIEAKYDQMRLDAQKAQSQHELELQQTKYNAIATMVGGLGDVFSAFGEEQKEWLILQKTLAMGEIMIAQAVAIANAIKQASQGSITVWDMIAQIATGVTAVTTAMVQAFTALDSAKFATGGYISGAGTGTSDSIPIRVSNGESVMNANTTAMFSGLLSSLNQLGGGVPIQATQTASSVRGEDMLARAVAKGVAMLPAPVVSVEDINRGQRQVQVMNERATL